jgi:hypothetical protein
MSRVAIFIVQIAWMVVLGALVSAFFIDRTLIPLADSLGSVPLAVIWFGALGAVLISLTGIVEHAHDWDESFALWHLSRPLVGASLAVIGVLIVQAGVLAIGSSPTVNTETPKNLLYYLIAFLFGYREETFRELIKRLVDLILAPSKPSPVPTITGLGPSKPSPVPTITGLAPAAAPMAGGGAVVISGSGFTGATAVTFGLNSAAFKVDSDTQITAQLPKPQSRDRSRCV